MKQLGSVDSMMMEESGKVVSAQSNIIAETYRKYRADAEILFASHAASGMQALIDDMRTLSFFTVTPEPTGVIYREEVIDGMTALWADASSGVTDRALLYFHGGGYFHGNSREYRWYAGHLAKLIGFSVLVVDYRLAPEHRFPAQLEDALAAYRWLLGRGFAANQLALAGDSAGGGLALGLLLKLKEEKVALPAAAVILSGWHDLTASSASLERQAGIDLLVTKEASLFNAEVALGDGDRANPMISPVFGDFSGVTTPVYLQVGGAEGLIGENLMAVETLARGGVPVRFEAFPEMQHVFQQGVGRVPEADEALGRVAAFLRPLLRL